ncbi:MAG: hypothetical protein AAGJ18_12850 [Bacteroidota bacterium]
MKVKSGVTLEEIRAGQAVKKISFNKHMEEVGKVEWDEPLLEALKSLD